MVGTRWAIRLLEKSVDNGKIIIYLQTSTLKQEISSRFYAYFSFRDALYSNYKSSTKAKTKRRRSKQLAQRSQYSLRSGGAFGMIPMNKDFVQSNIEMEDVVNKVRAAYQESTLSCSFKRDVHKRSLSSPLANNPMSRCHLLESYEMNEPQRISLHAENQENLYLDIGDPILISDFDACDLYEFDIDGIF
jgi:hypothetical protein